MKRDVFLGSQRLVDSAVEVRDQFVEIDNELFYCISNYTQMAPFFMTITSSSNHWMFISSTGGLTAGRINSEHSIFPYYTDDRITENCVNTGPKTIVLVTKGDITYLWKPFEEEGMDVYCRENNIYKNVVGNILRFEEVNETLGVSFSYSWMNSKEYGWVRKSIINNLTGSAIGINIVDGVQNVLPSGVKTLVQNEFSCLLNGYKRTELDESGLGLFTLSATLTDLAEPSEALKANTIWHHGLNVNNYMLGVNQLKAFSHGEDIQTDRDYKGERGCYFVQSEFILKEEGSKEWIMAIDIDKDLTEVNKLKAFLNSSKNKILAVKEDVDAGTAELTEILNQNDGIQYTNSQMNFVHHQANVLFNIMRGGFFYKSYMISRDDFAGYVKTTNKNVYANFSEELNVLSSELTYDEVLSFVLAQSSSDLERMWYEYLPLTFSRRHGDPSRPWNQFSIETTKEDGSAKLDYQGNWRDIFQNWEALCYSYPEYIKHVISKFFNASTKDGYNPYRVSKSGIDWEYPEPDNPWSNIGYWSDHQIIYLLKLLEMYKEHKPANLFDELNIKKYTFANVPYEIRSFEEIIKDPYETIKFDYAKDEAVKKFAAEIGADGKMMHDADGLLVLSSMSEKLLIHLLTKLGNFIPEGGIWMNTQRPEWNDANNALVGKGISVVTLAYIRRYISFMLDIYNESDLVSFTIGDDIAGWLEIIKHIFADYELMLSEKLSNKDRYNIVKSLGVASQNFRDAYYANNQSADVEVERLSILEFLKSALKCVDDSLYKNRRDDNLFHSYNTLEINNGEIIIHNLYEMLEGQVAILTSGLLTAEEAHETFTALRTSQMYREDQHSYMLYPNRELPKFTEKNIILSEAVESNKVLKQLIDSGNRDLITKDVFGQYHFNGDFNNSKQVVSTLENLGLVDQNREIENLFEVTFNHQSFTGRSGTFFAYEGLGSIYWHMVSKLLLAAQENLLWAIEERANPEVIAALKSDYYDIRAGIGYNKSAEAYGAFPFDPYSHTPSGKGAKQPGMTGQVKEEVITRMAEMGLRIKDGVLGFDGSLIDEKELLSEPAEWNIENNSGEMLTLKLPVGSIAGTHCQTPYIVQKGDAKQIIVHFSDNTDEVVTGDCLTPELSLKIFKRDPSIKYFQVWI